jgi:hypothetical protein
MKNFGLIVKSINKIYKIFRQASNRNIELVNNDDYRNENMDFNILNYNQNNLNYHNMNNSQQFYGKDPNDNTEKNNSNYANFMNYNYNNEIFKNEINNKNEEDEYNNINYNNQLVNQSVKNLFQEEEKNALDENHFIDNERNKKNRHVGAYEKNHLDSSLKLRNSFAYDSKLSRRVSNGKTNDARYLRGKYLFILFQLILKCLIIIHQINFIETLSSKNLKRIYNSIERDDATPKKTKEELEVEMRKKKSAAEKCYSLYENGKIKNEINRLLAQKNDEIKRQTELKECTFFPKTNFKEKLIGDKNSNNQMLKKLDSNFYDRIVSWQQKKEKK